MKAILLVALLLASTYNLGFTDGFNRSGSRPGCL